MPLPTDLFDYSLPPHLVAQTPALHRDHSRLLVVDRASRTLSHHVFSDLPQFLRPGDILIRNNASVLPARLLARRPTGGAVECFLLHAEPAHGTNVWTCLVKPGKKLPPGATFTHGEAFTGEIVAKQDNGCALVRFSTLGDEPITAVANRLGQIPLPPYIEREGTATERSHDIERYQTVYADQAKQVAVAAPTAGLHFTPELLAKLQTNGVSTAEVTLHVGLGTFKPITAPAIEEHAIHRELYELPPATQRVLFPPCGRRIAVGTTSVRSIEDFLSRQSAPSDQTFAGEADIFIYPPRTFRGIDALITNFHQPRSTLLCLVSAFLAPGSADGIAWIREIYAEAIAREYRFFSYGDAMLIL
ncbi:MAG: tRNA preQ1(34) S-adenosylmethionine ribosyltransferase-isomerase QueA [Verrucomicrobia bacterium]|nr:tRNA preQ1(34) S-adenosylmethionine ribosyltransferase-isomerase QueA [Verrucomicrobiota bacterium]